MTKKKKVIVLTEEDLQDIKDKAFYNGWFACKQNIMAGKAGDIGDNPRLERVVCLLAEEKGLKRKIGG